MRVSRWIADASIAGLALWVALILAGLLVGTLVSRWNETDRRARGNDRLVFAAAAASVIAWFANAGSLIGGSAANALLTAFVPIDVEAGYRLAVLWATLPGAALTTATALLVRAALAGGRDVSSRTRFVATLAILALVALGVAVWFTPAPNAASTSIPPFVQSAAAALAPLAGLVVLILLADIAAARVSGVPPDQALLRFAWSVATIALVAEQLARSQLGVGPRDAILLGSASSGLVLWVATSGLLHRRVQSLLIKVQVQASRTRTAALAAHLGAIALVISFALHGFAARSTIALPPGGSVTVTDSFKRTWQLANQGVSRFDAEGVDVVSLAVEARNPGGAVTLLTPEIRDHHGRGGEHLDNAVSRRRSTGAIAQSLRVLLVGVDSLDVASVRVTFLPLPALWPAGTALLVLSLLMMRRKEPDVSLVE